VNRPKKNGPTAARSKCLSSKRIRGSILVGPAGPGYIHSVAAHGSGAALMTVVGDDEESAVASRNAVLSRGQGDLWGGRRLQVF